MADFGKTTRTVHSSTLSHSIPESDVKRQRLARQISHRPHASNNFHAYRHPTRETAQQIGADIANFLSPTRFGPYSAATSRTLSRSHSGEGSLAVESLARDHKACAKSPKSNSNVPSISLQRLEASRRTLEQDLVRDQEELMNQVLSGSRQVDVDISLIQDELNTATEELVLLRQLAQRTSKMNLKMTNELMPAVSKEHSTRLADIQMRCKNTERDRIGGLEKRLEESWNRVQVLRERMELVIQEVGDWESKDAVELRLSRKRHFIFWAAIAAAFAFLILLLLPRPGNHGSVSYAAEAVSTSGESEHAGLLLPHKISPTRLRPPPEITQSGDVRLRLLDEL